jgi:two-component system response regulator AtoC
VKVLIVDDEKNIRDSIAEYLRIEHMECVTAEDGLAGKNLLEEDVFDAVVLDLRMPGMSGLELLTWLKNEGPEVPAVMVSAFGEVQDAVGAMKLGARDYLVKPFDPEELVLRLKRIEEETRYFRAARRTVPDGGWVGDGLSMRKIKQLVARVAPTLSAVLITGESGTGKEIVAREIHRLSPRKDGPFVPINLGGIPDNLIESELFGYEKGAFTGADRRKEGLFEIASSGTLFLDEIGDMPVHLQVKLLRVLQDKKIQRLGGTGSIPIDVRILAATNRDLEERLKEGSFREDLYYRLNVIRVHLPPLRDRPEDIPELAAFFVGKYAKETGALVKTLSPEAVSALASYRFPGNVRELENMIERACILAEGTSIRPTDLAVPGPGPVASGPSPARTLRAVDGADMPRDAAGPGTVKEMERRAVIEALKRRNGNRTRAAEDLGISRRTLHNKIKEYGIG